VGAGVNTNSQLKLMEESTRVKQRTKKMTKKMTKKETKRKKGGKEEM
jgi:hypothetical protein